MKISQELKSQPEVKMSRSVQTNAQSFQKLMQTETKNLKQQEIEQLMKNISLQGDKLARFRSLKDLVKFKRMIKGFLQETVSGGYQLQSDHSIGFDGSTRKLTVLKELDDKLLELTEDIMNQEKKTVDILGLIGEIKGLLINIYT
jgi:hypothetical protein